MSFLNNTAQIKKLFSSLNKFDEFEVMFNNFRDDNKLSFNKFMNVLKYLRWRSDSNTSSKNSIVYQEQLDIAYNYANNNTYRVTINDNERINNFLNFVHLRKNHIIFSILLTQFINDKNFQFIKKEKDPRKKIDFNDFDIRIRSSSETPIDNKSINNLANIPISEEQKIVFRYKNRISLILIDTPTEKLSIDITIVKCSESINKIEEAEKTFELEIDYNNKGKINEKSLDIIMKEITKIKQVIDETEEIVSKDELDKVVKKYKDLVYGKNNESFKNLYKMQPVSTEVQHILEKIPNKYSVTDKADGDNFILYITQIGGANSKPSYYLINGNLVVRKLSERLTNNFTHKFKGDTILEGELIHLTSQNKYLFATYDCLFFEGEDIRNESDFNVRLNKTRNISGSLTQTKFKYEEYSPGKGEVYDIKKQQKFYQNKIEQYYKNLNELISSAKENDIIFSTKLFFFPTGALDSEAFMLSYLIWYNCTENQIINCPYMLDGIIYTGINQKYTSDKREQKYPIYKFKPPEMNSLDVYIEFQRNQETGTYFDIFDNSLPDIIDNQTFRITNFYVGDSVGSKEVPVPFMKDQNNHEVFLPIVKGQVRDIENNIVQDKTVIEVIYNNNLNVPHQYRWTVLRTRYDKTDSVMRFQKRYGNFTTSAVRVWKSMIEAVTIRELKNLANPDTYYNQKKTLEARITSSVITTDRQQDKYYQKITSLAKVMREFHNWIKSSLIYTYARQLKYDKNSNLIRSSVLDFGCGRGGDLMKWYHAKVGYYVGIDPNYEGIHNKVDGALSRYNDVKKKFPGFGDMNYIQADASHLLNSESQLKVFPNMSKDNLGLFNDVFGDKNRKFDIINSSFAIHYLFSDENSVDNLVSNISNLLKIGGFIICELFDADLVMKMLGENDTYTSFYTDEEGKKRIFYEIVKKFDGKYDNKIGRAIDVHMSWFCDDGQYFTEYLVSKDLMVSTMKKAGCYLIDTDIFRNVYNLNKDWFERVAPTEENIKNKKFYAKVQKFYEDLDGPDKQSKEYSFLNRYYIFKKIE